MLGAISPFALPNRHEIVADLPVAAAPAAAPAAPAADTSRAVVCPAGAVFSSKSTPGHLDNVALGPGAAVAPATTVVVPDGVTLQLGGWIVLPAGPARTICAIVDGHPTAAVLKYGIARPDVAAALSQPADGPSGFLVTLHLKPGPHKVTVGAVEADGHTVDGLADGLPDVQAH